MVSIIFFKCKVEWLFVKYFIFLKFNINNIKYVGVW